MASRRRSPHRKIVAEFARWFDRILITLTFSALSVARNLPFHHSTTCLPLLHRLVLSTIKSLRITLSRSQMELTFCTSTVISFTRLPRLRRSRDLRTLVGKSAASTALYVSYSLPFDLLLVLSNPFFVCSSPL